MSINRISDIPPATRPRVFKGSFESLKVNGQFVRPSNFTVGELDIDYDTTKDNNTYVNISTNGNTELYGYLDDPYYQREDYVPTFGGVVHQVTDLQTFTDAISNAVDGDRIQLMNNITVSFGETFTITASIEIFATENTIKLISVNGLTSYFLDVFSTDFSMKNVGLAVNSSLGPGIRLNPGVKRSTFSGCDFTCNRAIIVSYADDIYVYDNTFSDLAAVSQMEYIICFKLKTHTQIKRNTFIGNLVGVKSTASAITLSPAVESDFIGELFIEANAFGLNTLGKEMVNTLSINGQAGGLKIYMHNNYIYTNVGVISITNDNLLEGIDVIQITKNTVINTDDPDNFKGFTYIDANAGPIIYTGDITSKLRAYNNTFPGITQSMLFQYFILLQSSVDKPYLTYNINDFFINDYEPIKINPPLIAYISIDTDPDIIGSEVLNPMQENLNANNYNITGLNELSLATLRSVSGTNVSVVNDLDFNSSHDITNVRKLTVADIDPVTVGGTLRVNCDIDMQLNKIEAVDTLVSQLVKASTIESIPGVGTDIILNSTLYPTNQNIELGKNLVNNKFGNIYSVNGNFDTTNTDNLTGITQDINLNTNLVAGNASVNLGDQLNPFNEIWATRCDVPRIQSQSTSSIEVAADLVPGGSQNIGASNDRFDNVYTTTMHTNALDGALSTNVITQCNLIPDIANSRTIGNVTFYYKDVYTRQLASDVTLMLKPNNTDSQRVQIADSYVRPLTDGQKSLGLAGNRWTTVFATNGTISTSSRTQKKDIIECKMGLGFINKLQPKMYRYNEDEDDAPMRCGLIYEDVEKIVSDMNMPFRGLHKSNEELIDEDGEGTGEYKEHYGIHYESFVPILITAMKEMKAQNEDLLRRIEVLESK